jgi:hypothetical protein
MNISELKREIVIRRQKQLEIRGSIIILFANGTFRKGNQINTGR